MLYFSPHFYSWAMTLSFPRGTADYSWERLKVHFYSILHPKKEVFDPPRNRAFTAQPGPVQWQWKKNLEWTWYWWFSFRLNYTASIWHRYNIIVILPGGQSCDLAIPWNRCNQIIGRETFNVNWTFVRKFPFSTCYEVLVRMTVKNSSTVSKIFHLLWQILYVATT